MPTAGMCPSVAFFKHRDIQVLAQVETDRLKRRQT